MDAPVFLLPLSLILPPSSSPPPSCLFPPSLILPASSPLSSYFLLRPSRSLPPLRLPLHSFYHLPLFLLHPVSFLHPTFAFHILPTFSPSLSHFYYLLHSVSFNHLSFIVRPSSLPPSSCPASFPVIITSLLFQFPPRSTSSHPLLASGTHQGDRRGKKKCWAIPEN